MSWSPVYLLQSSIVEGATGFVSGDIVTQIDDCRVNSVSDWVQCLVTSLQSNYTVSYKIPQEMLGDLAHPVSLTGTQSMICPLPFDCLQVI